VIAEERARLEEAQQMIHISEDDAVYALSVGLMRQSLLLEDASQDGLTVEQTIAKQLVVVRNQEKLMRSELENRRELQSLRESMQHTKADKLELPLTAKSQQVMSPTQTSARAPKLNGTNYLTWKLKTAANLRQLRLWKYVIVEEDSDEYEDMEKQGEALDIIMLIMEENQLLHIRWCETAAEAWKALSRWYEGSSMISKAHLKTKFFAEKPAAKEGIEEFVKRKVEMADMLNSTGESVTEVDIVHSIISKLPEEYATLVTAIEAKDESELTVEFVTEKILHEERKHLAKKSSKNGYRASASGIKCFNCGDIGHKSNSCPKKKKGSNNE
jgi:hypothetical protein